MRWYIVTLVLSIEVQKEKIAKLQTKQYCSTLFCSFCAGGWPQSVRACVRRGPGSRSGSSARCATGGPPMLDLAQEVGASKAARDAVRRWAAEQQLQLGRPTVVAQGRGWLDEYKLTLHRPVGDRFRPRLTPVACPAKPCVRKPLEEVLALTRCLAGHHSPGHIFLFPRRSRFLSWLPLHREQRRTLICRAWRPGFRSPGEALPSRLSNLRRKWHCTL